MEEQNKACLSCSVDWFVFLSQKEVLHFLRDAAGEPTTEVTEDKAENNSAVEKMILENEKACLEKMKQDPPYGNSGTEFAALVCENVFLGYNKISIFSFSCWRHLRTKGQ